MKHTYQATIEWKQSGEDFNTGKYSRKHSWEFDGGISIPASSSPQVIKEPYSDAQAVDPEEAFVASVSSCHMLWFLSVAARKGFQIGEYTDQAKGFMSRNEDKKTAITEIQLNPKINFTGSSVPSPQEIDRMHKEAHEQCFIANSIKTKIVINPV